MKITIRIDTANDAFGGDASAAGAEAARILTELAAKVDAMGLHKGDDRNLRDINGNTVGSMKVTR